MKSNFSIDLKNEIHLQLLSYLLINNSQMLFPKNITGQKQTD